MTKKKLDNTIANLEKELAELKEINRLLQTKLNRYKVASNSAINILTLAEV